MNSYQNDEEQSLLDGNNVQVSDEMSQFVPSRNAKIAFGALAVAAITLGSIGVYYNPQHTGIISSNFQTVGSATPVIVSAPVILQEEEGPTRRPTKKPTLEPTLEPTERPNANPTMEPSHGPTAFPVSESTVVPTLSPTPVPTFEPTKSPVANPTLEPTHSPVTGPTDAPVTNPTLEPTVEPSSAPISEPTPVPTLQPSPVPTFEPTAEPNANPTFSPTHEPSGEPVASPTHEPTNHPVVPPVAKPTHVPTHVPSHEPTHVPVHDPTHVPVHEPTHMPVHDPTHMPVAPEPEPVVVKPAAAAPVKPVAPAVPVVSKPKAEVPAAGGPQPNYCSFTFTKGVSHFGAPKGCALFAVDDLSFIKPGEKTKAFYGCATADSTIYITEDELIKTGLMENGKSLMTAIFPGQSTFVTFYTNKDFTGYEYTFNSNYHFEMTRFHFKGTTIGNDEIKSIKLKSLTSSFMLPKECETKFHL